MVAPIFQKPHVETLKPYIQKTVDDLLSSMIEGGCSKPVDLVEKFSLPVPSYVRDRTIYLRDMEVLTGADYIHHPWGTVRGSRVPDNPECHPHQRQLYCPRGPVCK